MTRMSGDDRLVSVGPSWDVSSSLNGLSSSNRLAYAS